MTRRRQRREKKEKKEEKFKVEKVWENRIYLKKLADYAREDFSNLDYVAFSRGNWEALYRRFPDLRNVVLRRRALEGSTVGDEYIDKVLKHVKVRPTGCDADGNCWLTFVFMAGDYFIVEEYTEESEGRLSHYLAVYKVGG